jgi:hypothetical protein
MRASKFYQFLFMIKILVAAIDHCENHIAQIAVIQNSKTQRMVNTHAASEGISFLIDSMEDLRSMNNFLTNPEWIDSRLLRCVTIDDLSESVFEDIK